MDSKRLKELAGVVAESTEQEKALEASESTKEKVLEEGTEEVIEEAGMFGRAGYGGEKNQEQQIISELTQMLRDIKVFLRDGNMKDATMMVDRAYSRVAGANRGE